MLIRSGRHSDIEGILALQEKNLYANLLELERIHGFVTTLTTAQIEDLLKRKGVFVAKEAGEIRGYAYAGSWDFFAQWAIFPFMVSRLATLKFRGKPIIVEDTFQYGPVCLDQRFRGTGLFPSLFEKMRREFSAQFPVGITFINRLNQRSFEAHTRKLGLEVIDEFEFGDKSYYGLAFDTAISVLKQV